MGKTLIGRHNIEQYICKREKKIYLDKTMLLSPGGKDYLHEKGVAIVYGAPPAAGSQSSPKTESFGKPDLGDTIQEILKRDYALTDAAQIEAITAKVLAKLADEQ